MTKACREAERRVLRLLHGHETRKNLPQIHAHFLRHGLQKSNQVLAHFVSVCGSLNKMSYATRLFQQTPNPNKNLFNSMIKGYSLRGPFGNALLSFNLMKSQAIFPDEYTFAPLLKASSSLCEFRIGQCVHSQVLRSGFESFSSIQIGIVELCSTCLRMDDAKKVFDEMPHRDVIVWNLLIRGFCKGGNVDMGLSLFRKMSERSIVSWNSMISCLAQSGRDSEALRIFVEMLEQGFEPDDATVVSVLPVCARLGAVDVGQWIHSYIDSKGLLQEVVSVGNALIDFYCKCGSLELASAIFRRMHHRDVITWNVMVLGLAFNGKGQHGVELFEEMLNKGVKPNHASFVSVLACCAHAGLVEKGRDLFASMSLSHNVKPKLEHYGCMVDILCRNGGIKEAHDMIKSMPMKPNAALWGSLLSSCRTYGDLELAETALCELINLEPWNSGNYVLLSNIYAEEGRWEKVEQVRVLMRENCVKKEPGHSAVGFS
ncbi:pentatricopeptide repeat-containing protein At1g09190 [Cannabis sativa]|uniref:pentatricopeptide repeat-containing protein At1g09190 n=1 Tax=Cannabis sativa TaxID=3483 RepID=UPI0029C9BE6A|nr:pentatricopeptide repeat-containing protein At1g09190 [Cannabis sativa]